MVRIFTYKQVIISKIEKIAIEKSMGISGYFALKTPLKMSIIGVLYYYNTLQTQDLRK